MRSELAATVLSHPRLFVVLWLHTDVDPPTPEWEATVEYLLELRRKAEVPLERMRQLVISDGGAPNVVQRRQFIRQFHGGQPSKVAVLTSALSNPIKRGIATALGWVNPAIRFEAPAQAVEALVYLDLLDHRQAIRLEYHRLQARLRPVRDLERVDAELRPRQALKAFMQARLERSLAPERTAAVSGAAGSRAQAAPAPARLARAQDEC